ncbi:MAG TPA: hypothetical protein VJH90_01775 [archaeon]|nr:hypothetical protein [archaeon]
MLFSRALPLVFVLLLLTPQIALASPFSAITGAAFDQNIGLGNWGFIKDNAWATGALSFLLGINIDPVTGVATTSLFDIGINMLSLVGIGLIGKMLASSLRLDGMAARYAMRWGFFEEEVAGVSSKRILANLNKNLRHFSDMGKDTKIYLKESGGRSLDGTLLGITDSQPLRKSGKVLFGDRASSITIFKSSISFVGKMEERLLGKGAKMLEKITPLHEVLHKASLESNKFWRGVFKTPQRVRNWILNTPSEYKGIGRMDEELVRIRIGSNMPGAWKYLQREVGLLNAEPYAMTNRFISKLNGQAISSGDKAFANTAQNIEKWKISMMKKGVPLPAVVAHQTMPADSHRGK